MSPKIRICTPPCIVAKISIDNRTGDIIIKCPDNCKFATYEERAGPLDKYLGAKE